MSVLVECQRLDVSCAIICFFAVGSQRNYALADRNLVCACQKQCYFKGPGTAVAAGYFSARLQNFAYNRATMIKKFNWPIWLGFLVSIFAFLSYPLLFVNWEVTRDFPWANIGLFVVAAFLLFVGIHRAFAPDRRRISKILASLVTVLSTLVLGMFIFVAFIASHWLPSSVGAPQIGQKAPHFTLIDTNNKPISLTELLLQPINNKPVKGVLFIFYRGYW